ncbi:nicotinate phosphoribosyltransferase [Desulfotignum phosphitoxidans]|uniref:Nicotinate phosphoribosyltransferase n=1 Tax=Desulfotignum phosphitoxidans DSM 13687 TaxID=1286635 RepID=S0G5X9_9BACT|nr:nicotinate phosphoribosyltransferase [Desulfotignum phosphitoxidans]EMS80022.1 nicotinate phosphoribosyltransferase PncB [Desulfotignum phosphitoxidans DSM 13687]
MQKNISYSGFKKSAVMPGPNDAALFTDLYELTMLQAYFHENMNRQAVFSLFVRRLPPERNFLLACGLDTVLAYLENLTFTRDSLDYLGSLGQFSDSFLEWLGHFRFTGSVRAVPEGTPVFANEPILEITASLPQAQLIETFVMNQIHLQTLLASKAWRVVTAAPGKTVVDFGARRMHGMDAALKAARAFHIAGVAATSNVLAGKLYDLPVTGTMAHSYIQAHDNETDAFKAFVSSFPETVLLVDTYDTLAGIQKVIELADTLGDDFRVKGVRLDSGDLLILSRKVRQALDNAGLRQVEIFVSGNLDEYRIADLIKAGAPINGFGVGTHMGVSLDVPCMDIVYKLCEYAGEGKLKLSRGKPVLPGAKQVFRTEQDGRFVKDIIGCMDENLPGRPLLERVMQNGQRLPAGFRDLNAIRNDAEIQTARLPEPIADIHPADPPFPVEISPTLTALQQQIKKTFLKQ